MILCFEKNLFDAQFGELENVYKIRNKKLETLARRSNFDC